MSKDKKDDFYSTCAVIVTIAILVLISFFCAFINDQSTSSGTTDDSDLATKFSEVKDSFSDAYKYRLSMSMLSAQVQIYKTLTDNWISELQEVTEEQRIVNYIYEICEKYDNVDPELVQSIVYYESRYVPEAKNYNGTCVGLMQLSTKWHTERAISLTGSSNLLDPYVNLLTGIDLLSEMISQHGEENLDLVLMLYNGSGNSSYTRHKNGNPTQYVIDVLSMKEELENAAA